MTNVLEIETDTALDNAKRRQILEGARAVFLAQGFAAASMNDIARSAGVSKGTLYVYFENKEGLFSAFIDEERGRHIVDMFTFDDKADLVSELTRLARGLAQFLMQPHIISSLRVVIGIAERFPALGRHFFEAGPEHSRRRLAVYLDSKVRSGELDIPDTYIAATQFLELAHAPLCKPILFGGDELRPNQERVDQIITSAVHMFMAAYGRRS